MQTQRTQHLVRDRLITQVKEHLATRVTGIEFSNLSYFVDEFWRQLPFDDWQSRETGDIAGCCYSLWHSMQSRRDSAVVKVFNPDLDEHGWLVSGTSIMVVQKDMPFLVDSLRLELNRQGRPIHVLKSTLVQVRRDEQGQLLEVGSFDLEPSASGWQKEAVIYIESGLIIEEEELRSLQKDLSRVLQDVALVVEDYQPMLHTMEAIAEELAAQSTLDDDNECEAFIRWLQDEHFTFLGCRNYRTEHRNGKLVLHEQVDARQGQFKKLPPEPEVRSEAEFNDGAKLFYQSEELIAFSKSGTRSNVHRAVYPDYIVVKRFNQKGELVGETRILGLFTYSVYSISPWVIPIIRNKVQRIVDRSGLTVASHDGKNLLRTLETFPRDELFQSDPETLFDTVMGVASISERRVVRLFLREDQYGKFLNCLVYVPRDIYNTQIRLKVEALIGSAINSQELDSTTYFSESILARAQITFRLTEGAELNYDPDALEAAVVEITRGWQDRFESALIEALGETAGIRYYRQYASAFPSSYQESFDARAAVHDIKMAETLEKPRDIAMHFFRAQGMENSLMRFKVMHLHEHIELSDVIPIMENLGLRVLSEHPFKIQRSDGSIVWLHDFTLKFDLPINLDVQAVNKLFEQAFAAVWRGESESDAFNRLVLGARINWREVVLLRAYAAFMKQTNFIFSQDYIADTLANQLEITRNLVALFKTSFDPRVNDGGEKALERIERLKEKILTGLESVENLNEDRILRRYFELIQVTFRTNFFQRESTADTDTPPAEKSYVSFKLCPQNLADIPEPKPLYEIFVYSPRMEGVHLRGSAVARGGIRWSDRQQDYRTEILGLVKAQQVKNAVIVPGGAKGGFIAKQMGQLNSREEIQNEAIECYRTLMRGMLDLTDNFREGKLVSPPQVISYDGADPYLVVAADKGTATFSDTANAISKDYDHWLGDAFASGGSQGYDHKKMGITARGAWVSVQRHFREHGINIQEQAFSVVGIGDMGGDVFGNGMLLSRHIRLLAAFNHLHIFLDPDPDTEASFKERERLFNMPRSTWEDYDETLISKGGGVFSRSAKSITLTAEIKEALAIDQDKLTPTELIHHLLQAPVELIWNGGIGTYVKSSGESHADVGDKANDGLRVDANQLRCRVIGEGGNLGMTQLARVEYCLHGGACNTDFIDNSGGVDCSDHEVNIKILLDGIVADGDLTEKQRNELLASMTDSVADLVLDNNYRQAQALSLAQYQVGMRMGEYRRFIHYLVHQGRLDRELEFLPDDELLNERQTKGQALTRPELAVLLSYAKVMLKELFTDQNVASEPYLQNTVYGAFPSVLQEKFPEQILNHRLMKEIVATQVGNDFINTMGITSAHRLLSSTNASITNIALAYYTAKDTFEFAEFRKYLRSLDNQVPAQFQAELMTNMMRRIRRGTRWFIRNRRAGIQPEKEVKYMRDGLAQIHQHLDEVLVGETLEKWQARCDRLRGMVDEHWVKPLAMPDNLFSGLSLMEVARTTSRSPEVVAKVFYALHEQLNLDWFATQLSEVHIDSYWQAMARESFLDDLDAQLRKLATTLLNTAPTHQEPNTEQWLEDKSHLIERWINITHDIQNAQSHDFAMYSVAIRELIDLAQAAILESPVRENKS